MSSSWKIDEKQEQYTVWRKQTSQGDQWLTLPNDKVPALSTIGYHRRILSIMAYTELTYVPRPVVVKDLDKGIVGT